jgi:hypothetical protein
VENACKQRIVRVKNAQQATGSDNSTHQQIESAQISDPAPENLGAQSH